MSWNKDPVVLTVAVTGADVFRENNPNIPYTTAEIADSSIEAAQAGATVVHLHVREDDGTPSGRPELFKDVMERIRAGSDLLTMVSTGGSADMTIEERTTGLEAAPDISGVESGSMNFGDDTFITPPAAGRGIVERATSAGIALEVEAFDVGHVVSAIRWLEEGILPPPLRINLVFGVPGRHRRLAGGAGGDAAAAAERDVLDGHLHRPPPPAHDGAGPPERRTGHPHRPRGRGLHPARRAGRLERGAGRDGRRPHPRAGPRGRHPRADPRAAGAELTRRGTETREAIHEAALGLFARLGYHATSMRAIASEADVQPAAIYHWYPNKEAILVGLQDDFMERLTERVVSAVDQQHRPALKVAAAVREHVIFHGLHRQAAFVTDSEIRALTDAPRRALIAKRDDYQAMFAGMIRDGIRDGSLRTSDVPVATYAILLQCTGVALWFDPAGPLKLEEVAELHVELALGSLQASGELIAEAIESGRAVAG